MVKIRKVQKMLDSTLQAAKNATAPTAAKPVNAVHRMVGDTPSWSRMATSAALPITKLDSRRAAVSTCGGSV